MLRVKVPAGQLAPARAARDRRGLEPLRPRRRRALDPPEHPAPLARAREAARRLRRTSRPPGITTAGGCGDTVRNITGCPVQGIAADELFDATPIVDAAADHFYGNPDWANLPRKHKYSISACADRCNAPEINCISLIGAVTRRPRGLRRPRRRRPLVGAADRAGHGRLHPQGGRERDPRRDHAVVVGGPPVPRLAREGAAQVHGRRHRPRGHPRARRGAARPRSSRTTPCPPIDGRAVAPPRHPRADARRGSTTSASPSTSA